MTTLRILASRPQARVRAAPFHEWVMPDGATWTRFYRTAGGYLLRFPRLADFEVPLDALAVTCRPTKRATRDTCRHLYLNQVLPLVLGRRGRLVFHGSAVEIADGAAAFLGASGRGKSTLAASFAASGHGFMADDGLVLEARGRGFRVLPGHPSIRLWRDSREALVDAGQPFAAAVQYTDKVRLLAAGAMAHRARPLRLRRAYFLGDGSAAEPVIEPMGAAEALVEWVRNSFVIDPGERTLIASHFERVAALSNRLACYRLDYPRSYGSLARVRAAIVAHAAGAHP